MTVGSVTGASGTTSSDASTQLAANFDTFLKLLTAQLQNQDPLNPVDSSQFTQQLVQYSQVEQQIQTNSQLTALTDQIKSSSGASALSYIGQTGTFSSSQADLTNGAAKWNYSLPTPAAQVTLTVVNAAGQQVFQSSGSGDAGANTFSWDGKNAQGQVQPDGQYTLQVAAADGAGGKITPTITVEAPIIGVDLSAASPALLTAGGDRDFSTLTKIGSH
jgi:flagellar basal-body rod modification protein FlgD